MDDNHLKHPIGLFEKQPHYTNAQRHELITSLGHLHANILTVVADWSPGRYGLSYRPDGWNGRQVIHHIADSHMMALSRIKLALTEDNPVVKPYVEEAWAKLADYQMEAKVAIGLIAGIQMKMAHLFHAMNEEQWDRTFFHPESQKTFDMMHLLTLYEWHGRHHLGHLKIIAGL